MQSMLSSWRAARYPQPKHKLTILEGCCFSLQQNWKRLKECVVSISPDQRCVSASEEEERRMNIYRLWKQTKTMQSTPQGAVQRSKRRLEKNIKATQVHNNTTQYLNQYIYHKIVSGFWTWELYFYRNVCVCVCGWPRWHRGWWTVVQHRLLLLTGPPSRRTGQSVHTATQTHRTHLSHHTAHLSCQIASERHGGQVIEVIVSKWPQCDGHKLLALWAGTISLFHWWDWKQWKDIVSR